MPLPLIWLCVKGQDGQILIAKECSKSFAKLPIIGVGWIHIGFNPPNWYTFAKECPEESFATEQSHQSVVGWVESLLPSAITRCYFALSCNLPLYCNRFSLWLKVTHLNCPLIVNCMNTQRAIKRQASSQLALNGAQLRFYIRETPLQRTSCNAINFEWCICSTSTHLNAKHRQCSALFVAFLLCATVQFASCLMRFRLP